MYVFYTPADYGEYKTNLRSFVCRRFGESVIPLMPAMEQRYFVVAVKLCKSCFSVKKNLQMVAGFIHSDD